MYSQDGAYIHIKQGRVIEIEGRVEALNSFHLFFAPMPASL